MINPDLDMGYYKDRDSDADTGARMEVLSHAMDREAILMRIVMLGNFLAAKAEKRMEFGQNSARKAMAELRRYNSE